LATKALIAAETPAPITTAIEILSLSPEQADENRPVRLRAAITCYVPASSLFFVQDETAGIYIFPSSWPKDIANGEIVEVQGVTGRGRFSPIVQLSSIQPTGQKTRIPPKRISIEELNTGRYDAQMVELEGVVQNLRSAGGVATATLWTGSSSAKLLLFRMEKGPTNLVDATIRVHGVGGTFYNRDELAGFGLFAESPENLTIVSPAKPPFEAPLRTAHAPGWFTREGGLDHRIRVEGVVTVAWPGEALFVQDKTGAIRVAPVAGADTGIRAGDLVQVSGFIRDLNRLPWLDAALVRKTASRAIPEPLLLPAGQVHERPPSGELLGTDGLVQNIRLLGSAFILFDLQSANRVITALLKKEAATELRPGARVRVSGAWSMPPDELRNQAGPLLWLNSKASIVVLAPPKMGAGPLLNRSSNVLLACTIAALVLAGGVVLYSRRKSVHLAARSDSANHRLTEAERELQRLNEGRESLGRDLHDRIIQSIYAIGLNIDDCAQSARREPEKVESRLKTALADVNTVIAELRNVILGLETNAIQPRELRTALKSLALALGRDDANRIRARIDEEALNVLTPAQATELVHIAREALSNSIRHGGAQTTTFGLELREGKITFSIEDDGVGFNVKTSERKGFGLRNMAKRSEQLGALFSIDSEEGRGTRVVLDIPLQKQHFLSNEPRTRIDR
jgi:signal transduction histidine kinase